MDADPKQIFTVESKWAGLRLDVFLTGQNLSRSCTRSMLQQMIKNGNITVNGQNCKTGYKLRQGDMVRVIYPTVSEPGLRPQQIEFSILFEDDDLLVLSKPPGIVVHPAAGHDKGTLVHGILYHCDELPGIGGEKRPGIVHRLDKDTSGVMVVAKNDAAHHSLVAQFKARQVSKVYLALLDGVPAKSSGRIDAAIGRHPVHRKKMALRENEGRRAITNWSIKEKLSYGFSLVELLIETGRTHQIRVHMSAMGTPVAGDSVYGKKNRLYNELGINRQCLHAWKLTFRHPADDNKMEFTAPLYDDMNNVLVQLRR